MTGSILGTSVRRVEDRDLVTGATAYVANLALDGVLPLAFVRSSLAHARAGRLADPLREPPAGFATPPVRGADSNGAAEGTI
jgi:hypothetical protein